MGHGKGDLVRYHDVDAAIRDCLEHAQAVRAVDPEALAARVSWDRPNERRRPTVRKTGQEGSPPRRDPLAAVARGRMRALLDELPDPEGYATVCVAFGWGVRLARALRCRDQRIYDLAASGRAMLRRRMLEVGLLEAA